MESSQEKKNKKVRRSAKKILIAEYRIVRKKGKDKVAVFPGNSLAPFFPISLEIATEKRKPLEVFILKVRIGIEQ